MFDILEKYGNRVVRFQIDYIKHNSVSAFPTPIFLKGKPAKVECQIRSRHVSEITSGVITVCENAVVNNFVLLPFLLLISSNNLLNLALICHMSHG